MRKPTGGPAASIVIGYNHFQQAQYSKGITKRDYFAAKALEALILKDKDDTNRGLSAVPKMAQWAYEYADAMLAERNKGE